MINYMKNKWRLEMVSRMVNLCFWIMNFSCFQICMNMFLKVISARRSKWLDEGLKRQMISDPFIINKTELVMNMLMIVLGVIMCFFILSIVFFRNIHLKNMLVEMGIYRVSGYDRKNLMDRCIVEPIFDIIISFPVSLVVSTIVWKAISKIKMISFMMAMMNDNILLDVLSFVMCAGIMVLITIIHTKVFMERSLKKGIRYMLGQGVV